MRRASAMLASTLLLLVAMVSCTRSTDSPFSPSTITTLALEDIVASASVGGVQGVRREGSVAPGGGPSVSVSGNQTVVNGGTLAATVTSATPFETLYVFAGADALGVATEGAVGLGGFYEITLPAPQTSASVLLIFPQTIPLDQFDLLFAGADGAGNVGPFVELPITVTQVGTGDIQVTLSWDANSDVDLHVVEPGGEETYYARRTSPSGGHLDLDSNAGCQIDGVRNENISWPEGRAPRGVYSVRVDYWSSCGVAATNYTVRINNGGSVQIVTGSFAGPGDQGGAGSGFTVATFERLTGPAPAAISSNVLAPAGRLKEAASALAK